MLGAIAGDIIGSVYEGSTIKTKDFPLFDPLARFTDDTVLTAAVAECLMHEEPNYATTFHRYVARYPRAGYGGTFKRWALGGDTEPYNSWGNGSAMRVSPIGWAFSSLDDTLAEAKRSAEVTHNHPEGIKGAQAVAAPMFLARRGKSKDAIRQRIQDMFAYDMSRRLDEIRPAYHFDVSCQGSVPESIIAFIESTDVEDAIRNAISLGGDSDTMACIAGGIAEAFYGEVPESIVDEVRARLDEPLLEVVDRFYKWMSNKG